MKLLVINKGGKYFILGQTFLIILTRFLLKPYVNSTEIKTAET